MAFETTWMDGAELRTGRAVDEPVEDNTTGWDYYQGSSQPVRYTADAYLSEACYRFNPSGQTSYILVPSSGAQNGGGVNNDKWNVDGDEHWFGFHFKLRGSLPADGTQFFEWGAPTVVKFHFMNDGTIDIIRAGGTDSSTGTIAADTWYACALKGGRNATPRIIVKNADTGATIIDLTAGASQGDSNGNVWLGCRTNETMDLLVDNFIVCCENEAGQTGNPFDEFGARWMIFALNPAGDGTRQDQDSGDWTDADEILHDSDTTYMETSLNDRLTVLPEALPPGVGTIAAVQIVNMARINNDVEMSFYINSTDYDSTGNARMLSTYATAEWLTVVNPDTSSPWTISDLRTLEFGVHRVGAGGTQRHTGIHLEVLAEYSAPGNSLILVF
jgi:hypothetical protein